DIPTSHVLPALIRKFHEAKTYRDPVVLWGTGAPRREFLHVDDMAEACLCIMLTSEDALAWLFTDDAPPLINVGCGQDLTIRELSQLVAGIIGYQGQVQWHPSKPDGTPRKLLEISRIKSLGWEPRIPLPDGIRDVYERFQESETVKR